MKKTIVWLMNMVDIMGINYERETLISGYYFEPFDGSKVPSGINVKLPSERKDSIRYTGRSVWNFDGDED